MNCERISVILDTKQSDELTPAERQTVEHHLASCVACHEVWGAYRELVALRVPAPPPHLRARIAAAIAALPPADARVVRRGFVMGVVLVAGVAAATSIALRLADRSAEGEATAVEETIPVIASPVPGDAESDGVSNALAPAAASPGALPAQPAAPSAVGYPLDRHSVVVIAVPDPAADSAMVAALATCHDVVLEHLRAVDGLNVIAEGRLAPFAGANLPETEIARALGAGSALVLRSAERQPSCNARLLGVQETLRPVGLLVFLDPTWTQARWQSFAGNLAASVREVLLDDPSTLRARAQADVLNTALSDADRMMALFKLRRAEPGTPFAPPSFEASVIAAVIQIGMTSSEARVRADAWGQLRGVRDTAVLQPLLYALVNDRDDDVRSQAARSLGTFVNEAGVRDALRRTAAEDPNDQPRVPCCIPTVRESARLALRADMDPQEAVRSAVLDEALTPHERLLLTTPQGLIMRLDSFDAEVARAVFALGVAADEPGLRARAWGLLADVREPDFKAPLLADLAQHPAENVRTAAARGLRQLRDDPTVRAALERALGDSSAAVQRAARASLDGVSPGFGL